MRRYCSQEPPLGTRTVCIHERLRREGCLLSYLERYAKLSTGLVLSRMFFKVVMAFASSTILSVPDLQHFFVQLRLTARLLFSTRMDCSGLSAPYVDRFLSERLQCLGDWP